MYYKKYSIHLPLLKNLIKNHILPAKISLLLFSGFLLLGTINEGAKQFANLIFLLSAFILTTTYASIIQNYLCDKTTAIYVKTFPLSSFSQWITQYLAGFLLIIGTLFIEMMCLVVAYNLEMVLPIWEMNLVFKDMLVATFMLVFFYYSISFFVVCITGKQLGQFIFTVAFYFVPVLLYLGIFRVGELLNVGYTNGQVDQIWSLLLPFVSGLQYLAGQSWSYLCIHLVLSLAFFIGSYFVYSYRPLEKTDEIIVFKVVNYGIRIILVLACTMIIYILIMQTIDLSYTYSGYRFLLSIALYIFGGLVIALAIEMFFKNEHIYRTLCIYLPFICFSVFICYQVGLYHYTSLKEELIKHDTVEMVVHLYTDNMINSDNDNYIRGSITSTTFNKITEYLETHKEDVYSDIIPNENTVYITFNSSTTMFYHTIEYFICEDTFQDILKTCGQEIVTSIVTYQKEQVKLAKHWIVSKEEVKAMVSQEQLLQALDAIVVSEYSFSNIFNNNIVSISSSDLYLDIYFISNLDSIYTSDTIKAGERLQTVIDTIEEVCNQDGPLLPGSNMEIQGDTLLQADNIKMDAYILDFITKLSDQQYTFEFPLEVHVNTIYQNIIVEIDVQMDNDEIQSIKIVEKEDFND
jgi:hypothetical protein